MRRTLLIFLAFFLMASPVLAATHYVAHDGATDGNAWSDSTDIGDPCALSVANANAAAGDVVYLRAGTYTNSNLEPDNSGTEGNVITFQNYNSETVVVDGEGSRYPIFLYGKSYITVDGIDAKDPTGNYNVLINHRNYSHTYGITIKNGDYEAGGIRAQKSSSLIIKDNVIHDHDWAGISIYGYGCSQTRLEGNTISGTFASTDAITVHEGDTDPYSAEGENGDYHIIKDNTITLTWDLVQGHEPENCIDLNSGDYVVIQGNNCSGACSYPTIGTASVTSGGLHHLRIVDNILHDVWKSSERIRFSDEGPITYVQALRNITYGKGENSYSVPLGSVTAHSKHRLAHNTFHTGDTKDAWAIELQAGTREIEDFQMKNNIFYTEDASKYAIKMVDPGTADMVADGNLYYNSAESPSEIWDNPYDTLSEIQANYGTSEDNGLEDNPDFTDVGGNDYTLTSVSPAIDAGVWLTTITSATGTSTTFTVADPLWFYDGWNITNETGDTIKTENGQTGVITEINYGTGLITVSAPISVQNGEGIALNYDGNKPDIGAIEYGQEDPPDPPDYGIENPTPADEDTGQSINVNISWTNGDDVTDTDIYFDSTDCSTEVNNDGDAETSYEPGTLSYNTKYYWKIVTNPDGENLTFPSTGCYEFTTIGTPAQVIGFGQNSAGMDYSQNSAGMDFDLTQ